MKTAFVFPGQGSQFVGMGYDLYNNFNSARYVFAEIDDALNFKLSDIIFHGNIEELSLTKNTQPALMAVSLCIIKILIEDFKISIKDHVNFVAGHSLGEYSAYAAANSISLSNTAKLLQIRGEAMQNSSPEGTGSMIALLGANINDAESIVNQCIASNEIISIANDNCPGQIVLSGSISAIDKAISLASNSDFKTVKLKVSAAFHSPLIEDAKPIMQEALNSIDIDQPNISLIANVTALPVQQIDIKKFLVEQITAKVRWRESINYLLANDVSKIIEIGAGKVLTNLNKRINKDIGAIAISSVLDIENLANSLYK